MKIIKNVTENSCLGIISKWFKKKKKHTPAGERKKKTLIRRYYVAATAFKPVNQRAWWAGVRTSLTSCQSLAKWTLGPVYSMSKRVQIQEGKY